MVGYDANQSAPKSVYAVSGAASGFITRTLTQPLDVIKIRFQLQVEPITRGATSSKYRNVAQAFQTIVREEGILALWKGTVSGQALSVVYGLVEFGTFEALQRKLGSLQLTDNPRSPMSYFLCGSVAGMTATLAAHPLDVIRTRFVGQGKRKVYSSIVQSIYLIQRREGFRGFYRGLLPALLQTAPTSGFIFALYLHFQTMYRNLSGTSTTQAHSSPVESLVSGFVAGAAAKTLVHPLDVAKKRLQVQGFQEGRQLFGRFVYVDGFLHAMKEIYRHEGAGGFFKGYTPSMLKAAATTGYTFFFYERILRYLSNPLS
ncbi:Mitochondrial thiamine pyrophosphate carrier [Hypsibius exemplaris]|uniref:Mitochondrial thiamine pyrophosphate carrier n=1 Tax=Hypsibius exemplaris TaxID=2072580 RepID=A0A1W0WAJ7_HYPEX|nr:Mitochondrial thiamine pyrophosphate carrier [Hypsibius exemplaris]